MCGIAGILDPKGRRERRPLIDLVSDMTASLRHRGPDSEGIWSDDHVGLALGHRRLAIVDLSVEGHQPMVSPSGRFVISFNGEIYNFLELRHGLRTLGCSFRGHSDTEVLLAGIERLGLAAVLDRAVGMFAFALWDKVEKRLHLVRDRLGKKPLYYGWLGGAFVFASELKALARHPRFSREVDRGALALFLRHQYVPAPWSIWRGLYKVPPGAILTVDLDEAARRGAGDAPERISRYWSARSVAEEGQAAPLALPDGKLLDLVEDTLARAVGQRMIADVPLGAFLSGGIDSSLIVALMQRQSDRPVKTFTIGFENGFYDEAAAARAVAAHLGTEHHELVVDPSDALSIIPSLSEIYDEPFADPSAVPTFQVARMARRDVTVCLSGDGGDELFAGYGRYALASRLGRGVDTVPSWLRMAAARGIASMPVGLLDAAARCLGGRSIDGLRGGHSGDRLRKMADLLTTGDRDELYRGLLSLTRTPEAWVQRGGEAQSAFTDPDLRPALSDPVQRMMYFDMIAYLPDDILVKVDRASMAVSLEARAPLLDHRVVELAWKLPIDFLRRDGAGKWPLRQLVARHLPPALVHRPKQGFAMPVGEWLRGPLRDWAENLLDARRLAGEGFLRPEPIRAMWAEHLAGRRQFGAHLWTVAMFQAWRETWSAEASPAPFSCTDKAA